MFNKIAICLILSLGATLGAIAGILLEERAMQKEAIGLGYAHYHYKTGEWTWGIPVQTIDQDQIGMFLEESKK